MRFSFLFVVCQRGAEGALKAELAREWPAFKFSFSRPGFVTFKLPPDVTPGPEFDLHSIFARTYGFSVGHVKGQHANELARQVWSLTADLPVDQLHVWQRDAALPGEGRFEPGRTALADEVAHVILAARPDAPQRQPPPLNRVARARQAILDCVLVEPDQWWIGWHRANSPAARWPGGVPPLDRDAEVVSRAYFKLSEALLWSRLPVGSGDVCAELGSAPGGSSQLLLERGLHVLGIDPGEMDEQVLANPHFTHIRRRAADVKRREFSKVRWLFADSNVAPRHTLDSVEAVVTHPAVHIRGLLLTLKLPEWELAEEIPGYLDRIRGWGFRYVLARQLAFNRQEICVCAMRNRAMRRFNPRRGKGQ